MDHDSKYHQPSKLLNIIHQGPDRKVYLYTKIYYFGIKGKNLTSILWKADTKMHFGNFFLERDLFYWETGQWRWLQSTCDYRYCWTGRGFHAFCSVRYKRWKCVGLLLQDINGGDYEQGSRNSICLWKFLTESGIGVVYWKSQMLIFYLDLVFLLDLPLLHLPPEPCRRHWVQHKI